MLIRLPEPAPYVLPLEDLGDGRLQVIVGSQAPAWPAYALASLIGLILVGGVGAIAIGVTPNAYQLAAFIPAFIGFLWAIKYTQLVRRYVVLGFDAKENKAFIITRSRGSNQLISERETPLVAVSMRLTPVSVKTGLGTFWHGEGAIAQLADQPFIIACAKPDTINEYISTWPSWLASMISRENEVIHAFGDLRLLRRSEVKQAL